MPVDIQGQMNAAYFLWTKLLIGWFFGVLFAFFFAKLQAGLPSQGILHSFIYALVLWLMISLWAISHPLVYEGARTAASRDQIFRHIDTFGGFLGYGLALGLMSRKDKRAKDVG